MLQEPSICRNKFPAEHEAVVSSSAEMIFAFPLPYVDEIFWSVQARFADRFRGRSQKDTLFDMYGRRDVLPTILFPSKLALCASRLPVGHPCTGEAILANHTLYRWYAPFISEERADTFKEGTFGDRGHTLWKIAGGITAKIKPPEFLRYCPTCLRLDRAEHRELHWRRAHQLTGVNVCATHGVFLENSGVRILRRLQCQRFELPKKELLEVNARPAACESLFRVARIADELLSEDWPILEIAELRKRYFWLLKQKGYDFPAKDERVRYTRLLSDLRAFYPHDFLVECGCLANDWIARLIRSYDRMQPPIRHLLLLAFLNCGLREFFGQQPLEKVAPAEDPTPAPETCLNSICPTSGAQSATFIRKELSPPLKDTVFFFKCTSCGAVHARRASQPQGRRWIRDYGHVWTGRLTELWLTPKLPIRKIARMLGRSFHAVISQSVKLRLPNPRPGKKRRYSTSQFKHLAEIKQQKLERKVAEQRTEWLTLRGMFPEENTRKLRFRNQGLYASLWRYDRQWLTDNQPRAKPKKGVLRVDWSARDELLSSQIVQAAATLRSSAKPGVKLTRNMIARAVGVRAWASSRLAKLPKCRAALAKESDERPP